MVLKLLLGELKKKRMQTAAMVLMLAVALAFLIVSIHLIYSSTVMIKDFIEVSKVSSVISWKDYDVDDIAKLEQLRSDKSYIKDIELYTTTQIRGSEISVESNYPLRPLFTFFLTAYDTEYNRIFPMKEGERIDLLPREVAIPLVIAKESHIAVGDTLVIKLSDKDFAFTVKYIFRDALFGNETISTKRLIMNQSDIADIIEASHPKRVESFICADLYDDNLIATLIADFTEYDLSISYYFEERILIESYVVTKGIIAAMFLIAALFISFISFIIQRYSVHSTIEDEYSNIGLMKSTGFQDKQIIGIYFNKYLFMAFCGLLIGSVLGLIFSKLFLSEHFESIVIPNWFGLWIATLIVIALVGITQPIISYYYLSKIKKLSPIEMKDNREAKNKKPLLALSLYTTPKINSKLILVVNEFTQNFRHYLKILVTLLICFALLITVSNLKTTIESDDFIDYFGLTVGDIYINYDSVQIDEWSKESVYEAVDRMNGELEKNNEAVSVGVDFNYTARVIDSNGTSSPITIKKSSKTTKNFKFFAGSPPIAENEIALTNVLATRYSKDIGDTIVLDINGKIDEYIVAGINQAAYNMGELMLLPDNYQVEDVYSLQFIAFVDSEDKKTAITELQTKYPFLQGMTKSEVIRGLTGKMIDQISMASNVLIVFILLFAAIMATFFSKMLCVKDSSTLKELHTVGADCSYLFRCQLLKFIIIITTATLFGVICAIPVGRNIVKNLFSFTGLAEFTLTVNPINTFILLPAIFLIIVLLVSAIIQWQYIKKQSFKKEE